MSYEKQTWECGEIITAEKLNHIEDGLEEASRGGGGGGDVSTPLIVNASTQDNFEWTCDTTFGEIDDAVRSGRTVLILYDRITDGWEVYNAGNVIGTQSALNNGSWSGTVDVGMDMFLSGVAFFRVSGASADAIRDEYPVYDSGD